MSSFRQWLLAVSCGCIAVLVLAESLEYSIDLVTYGDLYSTGEIRSITHRIGLPACLCFNATRLLTKPRKSQLSALEFPAILVISFLLGCLTAGLFVLAAKTGLVPLNSAQSGLPASRVRFCHALTFVTLTCGLTALVGRIIQGIKHSSRMSGSETETSAKN